MALDLDLVLGEERAHDVVDEVRDAVPDPERVHNGGELLEVDLGGLPGERDLAPALHALGEPVDFVDVSRRDALHRWSCGFGLMNSICTTNAPDFSSEVRKMYPAGFAKKGLMCS